MRNNNKKEPKADSEFRFLGPCIFEYAPNRSLLGTPVSSTGARNHSREQKRSVDEVGC